MEDKKPDNPPYHPFFEPNELGIGNAFTLTTPDGGKQYIHFNSGASLLDHFAGLAMEGNIDSPACDALSTAQHAEYAYKIASAMLKERMKYV